MTIQENSVESSREKRDKKNLSVVICNILTKIHDKPSLNTLDFIYNKFYSLISWISYVGLLKYLYDKTNILAIGILYVIGNLSISFYIMKLILIIFNYLIDLSGVILSHLSNGEGKTFKIISSNLVCIIGIMSSLFFYYFNNMIYHYLGVVIDTISQK